MFRSIRHPARLAAVAAGTVALAAAGLAAVVAQSSSVSAMATVTPGASVSAAASRFGGIGARLPYAEVQAEKSVTNGTVIGPSYTQGQLADEASGRRAVILRGSGKYVTFTTPVATNSINIRYSVPDSADGSVYTAPLSLYINGVRQPDIALTNAYSWYYGAYPFVNTPSSGGAHHFFDETHRLLSRAYPAGTKFRLQAAAKHGASSYTIDFADFQLVSPPLRQPAGSVSVISKGASPHGTADATSAFNAAIQAAGPGGTVWIPRGKYLVPGHIMVNDVTVAGAGMWYSAVIGAGPGFFGNEAPQPSRNVHLRNFGIFGNVQDRDDSAPLSAIGGSLSDSSVTNIWIEHLKVGVWVDGPMNKVTFSGLRIRDTTADGINFHGGVTNSTITNSDIRNTGDDGIATWSDASIGADADDTISDNTLQLQMQANGIGIYGGHDNTITGNVAVDTGIAQGDGIQVGLRFGSTPLGRTVVSHNTMIRDGAFDPITGYAEGALRFDASQAPVTGPIVVSNALIEQSPYEAVQWVNGTISGVSLKNVAIIGAGTFALQEQTNGSATAANVTAVGVAQARIGHAPSYSCEGTGFTLKNGGADSGLGPTQCNGWPPRQ